MLKVMTLIGTRPEIIRLSRVISCLDANLEHILVHTGQNYNYELNEIFFEDLQIRKPDYYLESADANAALTIAKVISNTDKLLESINPDAFLILGDTNSCLAAIAAKKRKIPIFHMEAGNRCFDQRVPEEINRKIIDHISDINMPYSDIAREYLLNEGYPADRIIKTGSPMKEILDHYSKKINNSNVIESLGLKDNDYFVVSCHREENVDSKKNLVKLVELMNFLGEKYEKKIIFSTHPRTKKQLESNKFQLNNNVSLLKPLSFSDYVKLQKCSKLVLSDSGTITEESSILNFSAINIRECHERPEGMEETAAMMCGLEINQIEHAINILDRQVTSSRKFPIVKDYDVPIVSEKVLRVICSYYEYVNRKVWNKES